MEIIPQSYGLVNMAMLKLVRYMTYFNPSTRHVPSAYQVPCSQPPLISNTPYSLSRRSAHRLRGNRPGRDAMPVLPVELSTGRQRAKRKRKGKRENPPAPPIEKKRRRKLQTGSLKEPSFAGAGARDCAHGVRALPGAGSARHCGARRRSRHGDEGVQRHSG